MFLDACLHWLIITATYFLPYLGAIGLVTVGTVNYRNSLKQNRIQLIQRGVADATSHLHVLLSKPYLRPYFYEKHELNKIVTSSPPTHEQVTIFNEAKLVAELMLGNFAYALIHKSTRLY